MGIDWHGYLEHYMHGHIWLIRSIPMTGAVEMCSNLKECAALPRDWRRLNVALTRAKFSLYVVCNYFVLLKAVGWGSARIVKPHKPQQGFQISSSTNSAGPESDSRLGAVIVQGELRPGPAQR